MLQTHNIRICEIDIGNLKTRNSKHETFIHLFEFKGFSTRRERHNLSMLTAFAIVSSQSNQRAAPVAHKVAWPRPARKANLLLPRQELNKLLFLKSQPTLPVRDVTQIPWSQFLSGIFILTSLNDTSSDTPALMLHLTNPCAKRKVFSLTKPKCKIYKTKSLGNYITHIPQISGSRASLSDAVNFILRINFFRK